MKYDCMLTQDGKFIDAMPTARILSAREKTEFVKRELDLEPMDSDYIVDFGTDQVFASAISASLVEADI